MSWLDKRLIYSDNEHRANGNWCRIGGISPTEPDSNYGYPHVAGAIYNEDGSMAISNRCVLCGSSNL